MQAVAEHEERSGNSRRRFLRTCAAYFAGLTLVPGMLRKAFAKTNGEAINEHFDPAKAYSISIVNPDTGEKFEGVYRVGNNYLTESFNKINHLFRDKRTGVAGEIDRHLIDMLYLLRERCNSTEPFSLLSGYRTRKSNAAVSRAKRSQHKLGRAADIRLPGTSLTRLHRAARALTRELGFGGVGYYPQRRKRFIHIDTGDLRNW